MKTPPKKSPEPKLRRRAETKLAAQPAPDVAALPAAETAEIVHELRVHQIELELQNEELCRAQQDLEASRTRYADLYNRAPVGYLTLDDAGHICEVNETAARLLGLSELTVAGKPFTQFILPDDQDVFFKHRRQLATNGESQTCELRLRRPDGTVFWTCIEGVLGRDPASGAQVYRAALSDITGRKEAEGELRETKAQLESALAAGSVGTWIWDLVDNRVYADEYLSEMFSIESGSAAEGGALDIFFRAIDKDDRPGVQDAIDRTIKFDEKYDIEFRVLPVDKKPRWVLGRGRIERDDAGNALRFLGMLMDITERKLAASALRESEERFATIFKAAPGSMMLFSMPEGKTVEVNDNFSIITGFTREEALGKNTAELGMWADPQARERMLALVAKNGSVSNFEADLRHRSGAIRNGLVSGHMLKIHDRNYLLGVFSDITELKRAEKERQVIFDVIQGAISTPDLDEFLGLVHGLIGQIVYAENCFVMLHEPADDMVHFEFWADKYDTPPPPHLARKGFGNYVLRTGKPLLLTDELAKEMQASGEADLVGSASPSWLGVPLRAKERTIGVLVLQHYEEHNAFSERDLEFMASVGDEIALAIERKWAEDAAKASEESYRDLVENSLDIIYTHDLDGNFTSVNRAVETVLGYSTEEALTRNLKDTVTPEFLGKATQMMADLFDYKDTTVTELAVFAKDGRRVAIEVNARLLAENGIPAGVQGIARDITERKDAEGKVMSQLDELQRWYSATLDRENRILELKSEVNELLDRTGQAPRYTSTE